MNLEQLALVARKLCEDPRNVAFTGAGISTESGISDFRSPGGIWSRHQPVYFDEFLASHDARLRHWRMKKEAYVEFAKARPNTGHHILAELEQDGRLVGVVTQNIDGLHQDAGSRNVLELHGTARFIECLSCGKRWPAETIFERYKDRDDVPVCDECTGWLKGATVSFGQSLPENVIEMAEQWSADANVFLAIGSSLVVEPAASLPVVAHHHGAFLVIINHDPTPLDQIADVVLHTPIGETLSAIQAEIQRVG